ncbi:MAG: hypothetical protein LUC98_00870, partial [Lachnospiraceae bacterium]|nr:hypothetical protein [Lachnospiraceae bacterium]
VLWEDILIFLITVCGNSSELLFGSEIIPANNETDHFSFPCIIIDARKEPVNARLKAQKGKYYE